MNKIVMTQKTAINLVWIIMFWSTGCERKNATFEWMASSVWSDLLTLRCGGDKSQSAATARVLINSNIQGFWQSLQVQVTCTLVFFFSWKNVNFLWEFLRNGYSISESCIQVLHLRDTVGVLRMCSVKLLS